MKRFDNIKRSRLKLVVYFGTILSIITGYCAFIKMESAVVIGLGAIAGVIAKYTNDETKRKSIIDDSQH